MWNPAIAVPTRMPIRCFQSKHNSATLLLNRPTVHAVQPRFLSLEESESRILSVLMHIITVKCLGPINLLLNFV